MRHPDALIEKELLFEKLGYKPHSTGQQSFHDSTARYRIPTCGRRWGKSLSVGRDMTYSMFVPDKRYWIVGPDYSLAEKEFRVVYLDLVRTLKMESKLRKLQYNPQQGKMYIEMPWGTILEGKSAERPEKLVGEGLDGVIMSEAAKHNRETWERFIKPALSDKRGRADFPSTPEGYNWYQGLWELGQGHEQNYESWRFPSWENPVVYPGGRFDPEILEIERNVSKQYFDQEIGADFTTFEGQIYDEFDERIHVADIAYHPEWRNYLVFDFGYADPFVALDIMVDPADNVYVWREYMVSYKATYEHGIILRNRENPEGYHINAMFGDPRGADEIATLALVLGPIWARPVGWKQGVEAVKRWLKLQPNGEPKMFFDKSCRQTIRQMKALRVANIREGHNAREGQHDYDDHGPDTVRYFFSEFFINGAGASLSSVYDSAPYRGSEAESFFTYHSGISRDKRIGF